MIALEIPADPADQPQWLEQQMTGTKFRQLVTELSAVQSDNAKTMRLTDPEVDAINRRGLRSLSADRFRELLSCPDQLLAIQQRILMEGGDYWTKVSLEHGETAPPFALDAGATGGSTVVNKGASKNWNSVFVAVAASLATAAAMLISGFPTFNREIDPPQTASNQIELAPDAPAPGAAWGFAKFAATVAGDRENETVDRQEYFQSLAEAAEAWSAKRPANAMELASRIGEFRMGCSAIMLADHPLSEDDSRWLKDRCRQWAAALDQQLVAVDGGADVADVTSKVDSIVTRIAGAIRGRASSTG